MEKTISTRGDFYTLDNGEKPPLQFSNSEYAARLKGLRKIMVIKELDTVVLTSMHCVSYYTGFTYCSFGRPYACVVTHERAFNHFRRYRWRSTWATFSNRKCNLF